MRSSPTEQMTDRIVASTPRNEFAAQAICGSGVGGGRGGGQLTEIKILVRQFQRLVCVIYHLDSISLLILILFRGRKCGVKKEMK